MPSRRKRDSRITVAASDQQGEDVARWRFRTENKALWCSYREEWEITGGRKCALRQACFGIHMRNLATRGEDELLSVHCEPQEDTDSVCSKCKHGPHLHVAGVNVKSHFPLDIWWLNNRNGNLNAVTTTMKEILLALEAEVIQRM
jgi:hypothetical protein